VSSGAGDKYDYMSNLDEPKKKWHRGHVDHWQARDNAG